MARIVKTKELNNTKLATNYGGWIYCSICNENIGYLCYSTYDKIELEYTCNCKNKGSILIDFEDSLMGTITNDHLIIIKNRLCCPQNNDPLITLLENKLLAYNLNITCKSCHNTFKIIKEK